MLLLLAVAVIVVLLTVVASSGGNVDAFDCGICVQCHLHYCVVVSVLLLVALVLRL